MRKLAIFVEGQTEQIFAEKLLKEIAGARRVTIDKSRATGGRAGPRRFLRIEASAIPERRYYVLIVDCGSDESVASDIRDQYEGLVKAGYDRIIGIRDVYPQRREDIPKLERGLRYQVKTIPIRVVFVLAIMEIEAWFLAEHTHFGRLNERLTSERIGRELGFDPSRDDMELRDHPSDDLDRIYQLEGLRYTKKRARVHRTVSVLDYARVYLELGGKLPSLQLLIHEVDRFLA